MRGLTLTLKRTSGQETFTPDYAENEWLSKFVNDKDIPVCWVCRDGGYLSPATFVVHYTYFDDFDGKTRDGYSNVCDKHMTDEVENFRDMGK